MSTLRPGTPGRNIRVPDDLWLRFRQIAETNGSTASAVLVAYIRSYIRRHQP